MKKKADDQATATIDDFLAHVEHIRSLETELVNLKRKFLLDSASGAAGRLQADPSFLLVEAGGKTFAAPLRNVEEVVEMPALMPLPRPMPSTAGILNYHGELVAVIDMDELTGNAGTAEVNPDQVLVICKAEGRRFALIVEDALEVVTVHPDDITMSDKVLPGIMQSSGVLRMSDNRTALIVDLIWIAVGAHLGAILAQDAVTPRE